MVVMRSLERSGRSIRLSRDEAFVGIHHPWSLRRTRGAGKRERDGAGFAATEISRSTWRGAATTSSAVAEGSRAFCDRSAEKIGSESALQSAPQAWTAPARVMLVPYM